MRKINCKNRVWVLESKKHKARGKMADSFMPDAYGISPLDYPYSVPFKLDKETEGGKYGLSPLPYNYDLPLKTDKKTVPKRKRKARQSGGGRQGNLCKACGGKIGKKKPKAKKRPKTPAKVKRRSVKSKKSSKPVYRSSSPGGISWHEFPLQD